MNSVKKYLINFIKLSVLIIIFTLLYIFSFYNDGVVINKKDCIVVFGAAVWPGYYGPVPSDALADRTLTAVYLYKHKKASCIILSGADSIYGKHEVDVMTDIMLDKDIPLGAISLDRNGVDTYATLKKLDKSKSYIFVSNDFHLARIGMLAKLIGLDESGFSLYPAVYSGGIFNKDFDKDMRNGLHNIKNRYDREAFFVLREVGGIWYYFVNLIFD